MTTSKSLPARPSLESLRKQAKKLARDIAAGDDAAIARARLQLPDLALPLTQRNAQFVLAREYGYWGWQHLIAEVNQRLGHGLESATTQARRAIHDNDIERLKQLLAEHPALLSWTTDANDGGLLGMATESYGASFDPSREQVFTHATCAELLIDAGAAVTPSVCEGLLESRARGLLQLFRRKGLLPRTLKFHSALGDLDAVCASLDENRNDLAEVTEAFLCACRFEHEAVASVLLDRSIALDGELGRRIDGGPGRSAFVQYMIAESETLAFTHADPGGLWQAFAMREVMRALNDGDLPSFVSRLRSEPSMLADGCVNFQVGLIEQAVLRDREAFIAALFGLDPAVLRRRQPPPSQAIEFAFTYAKTHLLPALLRIWRLPDDLPHAAGMGDLAGVKRWFDAEGKPALGDVANHAPISSVHKREAEWGEPNVQQVLDTALAWAVVNNHFKIADFLLGHGADINTNWGSHEPASILHELVFHKNYAAMQFLIDRGIDMTIVDYRWRSTAQGWATHAMKDEKMAQWLREAQQRREQASR